MRTDSLFRGVDCLVCHTDSSMVVWSDGKELAQNMQSYNKMIRLAVLGEDQDYQTNMVTLDPDLKDKDGFPRPKVIYKQTENEQKLFEHAVKTARKVCRAGGADDWELFYPSDSSAHPLGTCRMGNDPDKNVVNRWGACHDVPGLYICDGSVLPTSGAVNPAMTITAVAARSAQYLIEKRGKS